MSQPQKSFIPDSLLKDKVIIISGASQGIGRVSALGFARAGAKVVVSARRGEVVEALADEIRQQGGEALGLTCDVTDEDSVKALVAQTVERFGRLDGLFNNAGIDKAPGLLADYDYQDWREIHDVKIHGTFLGMKHAIPAMIASGGGAIVNHGSCTTDSAAAMYPFASSSQSAIPGMTRVAAVSYAKQGVRINMISTGLILTEERVHGSYAEMEEMLSGYAPMGRPGKAEEIAQVAAWLLSDFSTYMTGSVVTVDGGRTAGEAP